MNDCVLKLTGERRNGKYVYRCSRCNSEYLSRRNDSQMKAACKAAADESQPLLLSPPPAYGVGSVLKEIFSELGIEPKASCGCNAKAAYLDRMKIQWCKEHLAEIIAWMEEAYDSSTLVEWMTAGVQALWQRKPVTLAGILDLAIERAEQKETERMEKILTELLSNEPRSASWRTQANVIEGESLLLDQAAKAEYTMPDGFAGRGIVTLGGSAKYFGAAYVLVSLLRNLGCQLPVEWWYLGQEEMDPKMIALAEALGNVQCVDLSSRLDQYGRKPRRIGGWEAKAWAIMYSRFADVLFLDADNVPAVDPSYLFDTPQYQDKGAVFWPDFPPAGWDITDTAWRVARLPIPGKTTKPDWRNATDYRPFETGQILVSKSRCWRELELTAAICDQSDFWFPSEYKGNGYWNIYGDKSAFALAWWKAAGRPDFQFHNYAMPQDCHFNGGRHAGAFIQHDFEGKVVFQHRVQPVVKWVLHGENKEVPDTVNHQICLDTLRGLAGNWPGHVWDQEDETEEERREVERHMGDAFWFRDGVPQRLTFDKSRTFQDGLRWTVRKIRGEWFLFISNVDRAVAIFGRDDHGNWCNHGTNQFICPSPPADFELPIEQDEIGIWNDIVNINEYRLPESFDPLDVIVDIGGHCGIFAWACLSRGAGRVVSVEPSPENFARLCHNLMRFGARSSRVPAAAWSQPGEVRIEQKDGARHTGGWSAMGTEGGVKVAAVSFEQLVESAASRSRRNIRLVKLDCEGSEWTILKSFTRWDLVDSWCGEYHNVQNEEAAKILREIFESHGYATEVIPHAKATHLGHFFAYRASES